MAITALSPSWSGLESNKGDKPMDSTKWIYRFDELSSEHNDMVGKKCAQLGEMTRAGFNVPHGFALSLEAYDVFMKKTGAYKEVGDYLTGFQADPNNPFDLPKYDKASKIIRAMIEQKVMPEELEERICRYYDELCRVSGVNDVSVATRSAGPSSHPGQYETFLHVQGKAEVMRNIIRVWSSTFNQRSIHARHRAGLPLDYDPIGVGVLRMVHSKAAGVMFTLNPANGDRSKIMIEGNWGLGESVVSGSVTPDEWVVDKVVMEIAKRAISNKTVEFTFEESSGRVRMLNVSDDRQSIPCLADEEILELARLGKKLEQHYGAPQDIEWTIDRDLPFPQNIFFVQTRPETIWSKKRSDGKLKTSGSASRDVIDFYRNLKA
jgi:pyruvate,water dikinase